MTTISNLHAREIAAPAVAVGEILATLGSADDRLWATNIWLTTPVVFDRPLGVGADGGHGSIRYSVVEYEYGRRIVFAFSPHGGLSGTHGFELEALGPDRCRLTHFLEAETSRWMRPIMPILIGYHDAMVETAFDRAELEATDSLKRRTHLPRWLRIANGTEIALGRALGRLPPAGGDSGRLPLGYRMYRPASVVVPAALAAIAAIHAAWALGWRWPGGSDEALAERVVGAGAQLPPVPAVWAVAALLGAAATLVAAVGAGRRERLLRAATWTVAGVLTARGVLFIPVDLISGLDAIYPRLDLALYSPLSIALGLGTAVVARGPRPGQKRRSGWSTRPHRQVA
jgi:hypothetical protein